MAGDDDDKKNEPEIKNTKDDAQLKNALNALKSRLPSSSPAELASVKSAVDILLAVAGNTPYAEMLKDFRDKIDEAEKNLQTRINAQIEQNTQAVEALSQEQKAIEEAEKNAINEARLKINSRAYDELIKNGFHEELKKDSDLLEKAGNNWDSLSEEEKKKISRQGLTEAEKAELEKQDQLKNEKINLAYQVEEDAEKVKKYHQDRLNENNKKYGTEPAKIPPAINAENKIHNETIANCNAEIDKVKPVHEVCDRDRKNLLEIAKKNPEIAEHEVKEHCKNHKDKYEKLKQTNPNHPSLAELDKLVELCGGREKLGLDKLQAPVHNNTLPQDNTPAQSDPPAQKLSPKIIEKPIGNSFLAKYSKKTIRNSR